MDCSLPGSSVHGILQARIPEWVVIPFFRGSSRPRGQIHLFGIGRQILYRLSHQGSPLYLVQRPDHTHIQRNTEHSLIHHFNILAYMRFTTWKELRYINTWLKFILIGNRTCLYIAMEVSMKSLQSYLTLCDPTDCSPQGSFDHEILQAKILEWVAIPFSRGSSQPRDWTCVSCCCC